MKPVIWEIDELSERILKPQGHTSDLQTRDAESQNDTGLPNLSNRNLWQRTLLSFLIGEI